MKKSFSASLPYDSHLDELPIQQVSNRLEETGTRLSVESLNWPQEFPYRPLTVVTAAHSADYIYIDFFVRCNYLRAMNYTPNSPVCEDSCVEFFVAPNADKDEYWNFEFNCIGTVMAEHHPSAPVAGEEWNGTKLPHEDLAKIKVYASVGTRPFQEVEGSFIWNVVVGIPLELLGVSYEGTPLKMRANFNKCAMATSQPHYLSWAPIRTAAPDFHRPDFFAPLTLE